MKIVIGYDGSSGADYALADLERAGLPGSAEALVISVAESPLLPPPPPSSYEIFESAASVNGFAGVEPEPLHGVAEQANDLAFQASRRLEVSFPNWVIRAETCIGSPPGEIIEKAEEWGADLIVVGSQGHDAFERFILGSICQRIVTEARCSVRVARRPRDRTNGPVRIVLGLDGSLDSGRAVRAIARREWPAGSEVRLVTSVGPRRLYGPNFTDRDTMIGKIHDSAGSFLKAAGLAVSSVIKEEKPKVLLLTAAEEFGADAIVIGARGLSRLGRILLGSVSTAVVSRAHCTVEVVRC